MFSSDEQKDISFRNEIIRKFNEDLNQRLHRHSQLTTDIDFSGFCNKFLEEKQQWARTIQDEYEKKGEYVLAEAWEELSESVFPELIMRRIRRGN